MYLMRVFFLDNNYCYVKSCTPKGYGAPLRQRIKRMRETPKAMIKYNNSKRAEKLQLLILNNFNKGYHVTLDYPKGQKPETYEEAEKNLTTCLHKVSRRLKKQGKEFKYIAVTERGKKAAALHHHMVIERDPEVVSQLFDIWGDHIHMSVMYEEGLYKELADYLVKVETKEEQTKGKSKYHRSRNLKKPIEKSAIVSGSIKDEPPVPQGYELIENTLINGFNEVVGVRYQHYMLRRIDTPQNSEQTVLNKCIKGAEKVSKKCTKKESIWSRIKNKLLRRRP